MRSEFVLCGAFLVACTGTIVDNSTGRPGAGTDGGVTIGGADATPVTGTDAGVTVGSADAAPVTGTDAGPVAAPLAGGIRITDIAVCQGVRVPIVANAAVVPIADRNAPVVAGKDGMIGVFVDIDAGWRSRSIAGELEIETAPGQVRLYTDTQTIAAASTTDPFTTGFAFVIDGADIADQSRYRVSLKETTLDATSTGSTDGAQFPAGDVGRQSLEGQAVGPLNLVIVPFQYNADGTGRLPPLDAQALQSYRDLFATMYPVSDIKLTVHDVVPYAGSLTGGGWNSWLDTLTQLRNTENPAPNAYYYGVAAPSDSFRNYCSGGCVVGLGWVPGANDALGRASVGVSFGDRLGTDTAAHEVGHNLGRNHAPCGGPSGVDPNFPYSGASIGVQGYHATSQRVLLARDYTDIMGYCNTQWISDYTYNGMSERLTYVNQLPAALSSRIPTRYRIGLVDEAGNVQWRRYSDIKSQIGGQRVPFTRLRSDGTAMDTVDGRFYRYDHLPGGMLLIPVLAGPQPADVVSGTTGALTW